MVDIDIKLIKNELQSLEVMDKSFKDRKEFLEEEIRKAEVDLNDYNKIKEVFIEVMAKQRDYLKEKIERLVTFGLQDIFQNEMKFKIEFSVKRNKLWAEFYIEKDGFKEKLQNQGGGIINVVSFLLRVLFIKLLKLEPILVLDEAFSMISVEYRQRMVDFVKKIGDELGIQLIIVTHLEEFKGIADELVETSGETFGA